MKDEKYKQIFRDLDVWLKQSAGFCENIDLDTYDFSKGDIHESVVEVYLNNNRDSVVISNNCKESIKKNTYCGDSVEVHSEYFEVTKGTDNNDTRTIIVPYSSIAFIENFSRVN